ncbi:MAG: MBL fold metallo-hydrolase [Sulfolobaceae archaeon]|nr:MBL fold metallo-hydrolase [Sulfolobaceae archaeon]
MIRYFGHSMVLIDDKIVIDPHDGISIGLPKPEVSAELVLITHDHYDHNAYQVVKGYKDVKVRYYGSFEFEGYKIKGFKAYHDKENGKRRGETAIYEIIKPNGVKIVHLGDLGHIVNYEELKNSDFMFVPVGGVITINASEAVSLIESLSPKIVIPIHYWVKGHLMPLDPVDPFINLLKWDVIKIENNQIDENNYLSFRQKIILFTI